MQTSKIRAKKQQKKLPQKFVRLKKVHTFATANEKQHRQPNASRLFTLQKRAFSSAGSEHLPYKQRVGGSNPSTPTTKKESYEEIRETFFISYLFYTNFLSPFTL